MVMKILMIAPQPFFQPRGTPLSTLGRLRALSHLGHKVDLLTYHVGQDVDVPGVAIIRALRVPFIRDVPIGPSWSKLFLDIFLFAKAVYLLQHGQYDLIHTHEEAGFFGPLLSKYFRIPHLYDMHSSLPQQMRNYRYGSIRPIIRLFIWLERWVINSAAALITICPDLADHASRINSQVPHMLIENMLTDRDPATLSMTDLQTFKATHALSDDRKIVLYAGSFEPYQGLDLLIASAESVLRQRQDVLFVLVGGKPHQISRYQRQVNELGLAPHFRFLGSQSPADMPRFIRIADVLVSPRTRGTNTPLKIYAYLQSGKPIVATRMWTHTQVLNDDVAILAYPEPTTFAQGLLSGLEETASVALLGKQARQLYNQHYTYQMFIRKTDQLFQKVFGSTTSCSHQNNARLANDSF